MIVNLVRALFRVLWPTLAQALAAVFLSLGALTIIQSQAIFDRLGLTGPALASARSLASDRFSTVLQSPILGQVALVAFWAAIGLVVYLICWGAYNLLVAARNEVTLETAYVNRDQLDGPWLALGIKILAAGFFVAYIMAFQYGASLWLALAAPLAVGFSLSNLALAALAVLGLAAQFYGFLVCVQLALTPWYTYRPFTQD